MDNRSNYGSNRPNPNRAPYPGYPPRRYDDRRNDRYDDRRPRRAAEPEGFGPLPRDRAYGRGYDSAPPRRRPPYDRPRGYDPRYDGHPYRQPEPAYGRRPYDRPSPYDRRRDDDPRYNRGYDQRYDRRRAYDPEPTAQDYIGSDHPDFTSEDSLTGTTLPEFAVSNDNDSFDILDTETAEDTSASDEVADDPDVFEDDFADDFDDDDFGDTDFSDDDFDDDDFDDPSDTDVYAAVSMDTSYREQPYQASEAPYDRYYDDYDSPDDDYYDRPEDDYEDDPYSDDHSSRSAYAEPEEDDRPDVVDDPSAMPKRMLLIGILFFICILAMALVPSGHMLKKNSIAKEQHSASFDIKLGIDSLKSNTVNQILGLPKVYTLPMSHGPTEYTPAADGYSTYVDDEGITHDTYTDDSISIDIHAIKRTYAGEQVILNLAKVKISHPSQLRAGFASCEYGTRRTAMTRIAARYNSILAINGEYYNQPGRENILIRHGTMYRPSGTNKETLFIDSKGDFIIRKANDAIKNGILENEDNKIYHTFAFGPGLVVDGKVRYYEDPINLFAYPNPRTAIGQLGELEYLIVVVEGRTSTSVGINVNDLAQFMFEQGCTQAYNFDGGHSSEMVYKDIPYNKICYGVERGIGDILYFATAIPNE